MVVKREFSFRNVKLVAISAAFSLLMFTMCNDNPQGDEPRVWECSIPSGTVPDYVTSFGCEADFNAMASISVDASIPGAISGKTVVDTKDPGGKSPQYFQNSKKYLIHHDFAMAHLSGNGKPPVPADLKSFEPEYFSQDRRFILGAITYYEGPKVWTYEISPYDNASATMIATAFEKIKANVYFGDSLYFHPTSQAVEKVAKELPGSLKIILTDSLFKGIDYQPLNIATSMGKLVFITAKQLETEYVTFRDIVVLDEVPNDISVTSGIITQMFQTPLAHINVLSQNRKTPNMALRGAYTDSTLRSLEGKWVKYTVGPNGYSVEAVTREEADGWWDTHKPVTPGVAKMDTSMKELKNVENILDTSKGFGDAIKAMIPAFGGKASHFSAFPYIPEKIPFPKAFAIPVYYYWQFMEQNGFNAWVDKMLADTLFRDNAKVRDSTLTALRDSMMDAPIDPTFVDAVLAKCNADFPGTTMRFRSSTNAEDLDGFTGAGLYVSKSGDPSKPKSVKNAIREVWSSVWYFRAFEERSYRNIDHTSVGMALLVHQSFPDEEATGVAITSNIFDRSGLEPGFYINVQYGDGSVVLPDATVTTDELICYFYMQGEPVTYLGRSNQLPVGQETVLTKRQVHDLCVALDAIERFFFQIYGIKDPSKWHGMDTEFKFDQPLNNPGGEPVLSMKQARPYPGMGQ